MFQKLFLLCVLFLLVLPFVSSRYEIFHDYFNRASVGSNWTSTGTTSEIANNSLLLTRNADKLIFVNLSGNIVNKTKYGNIYNVTFWFRQKPTRPNFRTGLTNGSTINTGSGFTSYWNDWSSRVYDTAGPEGTVMETSAHSLNRWSIISIVYNLSVGTKGGYTYYRNTTVYARTLASSTTLKTFDRYTFELHDVAGSIMIDNFTFVAEEYTYTPPPSNPTINWNDYSPKNVSPIYRNNTPTVMFFYNLTNVGAETCMLCNNTINQSCYDVNLGPVPTNKKLNLTATSLVDGTYQFRITCLNKSNWYNSSIKWVQIDKTQPTITCNYPLCTNATVHTNGTNMKFNFTFYDKNFDGWNVTIRKPDGTVLYNNLTDNITTTNKTHTKTILLPVHGTYKGTVKAWDDHNPLKSKEQIERVKKYFVIGTTKSKTLKAYANDITLETGDAQVESLLLIYNEASTGWDIQLNYKNKVVQGTKTLIHIYTTQPMRTKQTVHVGHIITGSQSIDFDGIDATVKLTRVTDKHYIAELTYTKEKNKVVVSNSINELNIKTVSLQFKSNAPPKISPSIPDMYSDTGTAWTYDANATDANGDTLTWYRNDSHISINSATGVISDSPVQADNGTYSIRINVTDGVLWHNDTFIYIVNISNSAPNITNVFSQYDANTSVLWTYDVNATDPENNTLTWGVNDSKLNINSSTGIISDTPVYTQNGTYYVSVNVTDTAGGFDNFTFLYNIRIPVPTAVNVSSDHEILYCLMYGNWTNSTKCSGGGVLKEGDASMIGISILVFGLMAFLVSMVFIIDTTTFIMRVLKLFFIMVSFYLTVGVIGLAVGFASDSGLSAPIISVLDSIYRVTVWVARVFTGIIFVYLIWESLTSLAQLKKDKKAKNRNAKLEAGYEA